MASEYWHPHALPILLLFVQKIDDLSHRVEQPLSTTMRFVAVYFSLLLGRTALAFFVATPATVFRRSSALPAAVDTSEIKNGMTIELDGEPHKVLGFSIMKQARGAAKTTIKFKNLMRGNTIENTYRSGEKFQTAMIEKMDAQFTYQEGVRHYCCCQQYDGSCIVRL